MEINLKEPGLLDFTCKNTFQPQSNTEKLSQGIGLENVKKRLKLMYPKAHVLNIYQSDGMYEVQLLLKLNKIG